MWKIEVSDLYGAETQAALEAAAQVLGVALSENGRPITVTQGEKFALCTETADATLCIGRKVELFRALSFLAGAQNTLQIEQTPCFDTLGFMIDVSRNAALTVKAVKKLLLTMAFMGFNIGMMYTEDVYEVENEPFFGYMRGRYSRSELKELDTYADTLGIELVPCIQTLGHLENALKWGDLAKYRDTASVMLVGDDGVYDLIDRMIASAAQTYKSRRIHLGMDEAMDLGLGRYLQKNGYQNGFEIIKTHLDRVEKIVEKHGLKPMIWSDMYFRLGSPENMYYDEACKIPQEVIDGASKNISLVYWDYYHKNEAFYHDYIEKHQAFAASTIFAGGMWTWVGAAVNYPLFFKTSVPALQSCKDKGIKEVLLTAWGDNGAEANIQAFMPGLQVYAEFCYTGKFDLDTVKQRFASCVGEEMQPFLDIGLFDALPTLEHLVNDVPNPTKFLLYQDPLVGLFDEDVKDLHMTEHYTALCELFTKHAQTSKTHAVLFAFYAKTAELLRYKAELGIRLHAAYQANDKAMLAHLVKTDIAAAQTAAAQLRELWRTLWFSTNKAFGFEVIDIRMGGIEARLQSTQYRIEQYLSGSIAEIEELACERLPVLRGKNVSGLEGVYVWANIVTAGKI